MNSNNIRLELLFWVSLRTNRTGPIASDAFRDKLFTRRYLWSEQLGKQMKCKTFFSWRRRVLDYFRYFWRLELFLPPLNHVFNSVIIISRCIFLQIWNSSGQLLNCDLIAGNDMLRYAGALVNDYLNYNCVSGVVTVIFKLTTNSFFSA